MLDDDTISKNKLIDVNKGIFDPYHIGGWIKGDGDTPIIDELLIDTNNNTDDILQ